MKVEQENMLQESVRSAEVQEIIGHVPHGMVRWGMMAIFSVMLLFLCVTWFIQYPDLLTATVTITTDPPPHNLVSRTAGNLVLLEADNAIVQEGDLIGYIGSNTSHIAALALEKYLLSNEGLPVPASPGELGDLQPYYAEVINAETLLTNFLVNKTYDVRQTQLKRQQGTYEMLHGSLVQQQRLTGQELILAKERFKTDSILFAQQVIASLDFNNAKTVWLQQQRVARNAETVVLNNQVQLNELNQQVANLEIEKSEKHQSLLQSVSHARQNLVAQIRKWKENYLFIAPAVGQVVYLGVLENGQFTEASKSLFSITPAAGTITARAALPLQGSGKVKEGQQVNIRLDNYPSEQFGMLRGKVISISILPSENNYWITIALPQELITSQNKKLDFRQQLTGTTEIITEDLRLLERFFYQFRKLLRTA